MTRLLLIDGHSVAYRAFFALPVENFSTSTGQHTNAVFGFTSMLINVLRDEQPTHVAVAFDVSRQTFRATEYAEYKANRSKSPDEFKGQVTLIKEVLEALGIPMFEKDGFEADDIIGTLATQAQAQGMEVLICTGDRDALQLVTPTTTVLYPRKGVSDLARMTPDAVLEKYGVTTPEHYPEIAALVGETSDNLPGVPGVGPEDRGEVDQPARHARGARRRRRQGAGQGRPVAARPPRRRAAQPAHQRARARPRPSARPADLAFSTAWDREAIHRVFDALEFAVLRERLFSYLGGADEEVEAGSALDLDLTVVPHDGLRAWLDAHVGTDPVGVEVAGVTASGGRPRREHRGATADGASAWFDVEGLSARRRRRPRRVAGRPARPKVLHDAKGQVHALAAQGWTLRGLVADTALATYLVRPDQRAYDLADLAVRYLHRELTIADASASWPSTTTPRAPTVRGSGARATLDLWGALQPELEAEVADPAARRRAAAARRVAVMERDGIAVDSDHLAALHAEFSDRMQVARAGGLRRHRPRGEPRLAQAAAGRALRGARHAADQEDQDRLHDRRRRAAVAVRQDRAPVPGPPARPPRRHPAAPDRRGLQKTVADDGRIHTTYYQTIAAPPAAQLGRPEPAEHPDPHRVRTPHP